VTGDSHAHVLALPPGWDREAVRAGVQAVGAVATDAREMRELLHYTPAVPLLRIVGWHPEKRHGSDAGGLARLLAALRPEGIDAVGEVGWPRWYPPADRAVLERQAAWLVPLWLKWAREWNKPVVVHAVGPVGVRFMLDALRRSGVRRAVFHWHKAPGSLTEAVLAAGYWVGVTPEVAWRMRDVLWVRWTPPERVLWETDAPWGHGGQPASTPADVVRVAEGLARWWRVPVERVVAWHREAWEAFWGLSGAP
jgi:TatD DNase family protein